MKNEETKKIRYADLFGGVGGFRLGIERAWKSKSYGKDSGQERDKFNTSLSENEQCSPHCVFYCDSDKYAVQTYNKNFKENWKATDIKTIKTKDIPEIDMLCGGFPCQSFSIAGKRGGFNDTRGTLFFEIARIVKAKRPKIVFLENVKGLLNHNKGETFRTIIQTLSELGYDVQWMVLNSKFFGVPQNRERVFIIGSLRGKRRPEILPFGNNNKKVDEDNERQIKILKEIKQFNNPIHSNDRIYSEKGISPSLNTAQGGRRQPLIISSTQKHNSINDDGIINCLPSAMGKGGGHIPMKVEDMRIRRLTPLECERLQGFPDCWTEGVSDNQRYKQIGNAVTVNVIEAIASKLLRNHI